MNGWDQRVSVESVEAGGGRERLCWATLVCLREEMDERAASFRAWRDDVRFDLKDGRLGRGELRVGVVGVKVSSSEVSGPETRGWSVHSSRFGSERDNSLRRSVFDLRLRSEPGVDGLLVESKDRSSASRDGIESLDIDRMCRYS